MTDRRELLWHQAIDDENWEAANELSKSVIRLPEQTEAQDRAKPDIIKPFVELDIEISE